MNYICRRSRVYPILRSPIPDCKVPWNVVMSSYKPPCYTSSTTTICSADPEIENDKFQPKWNDVDGNVDRRSYDNNEPVKYLILQKYPLNPRGRTGLCGRGSLYRWGPNHAADAVVTRWKQSADKEKELNPSTSQPILQFLAILRKDCRKWAIPGGFLNTNEEPSAATLRELFEEAININLFSEDKRKSLKGFFENGTQVYKGYVDDPRNTDNAWIETTATNFHDDSGAYTDSLILEARDDAVDVKWIDIEEHMDIYETHNEIIKSVNELHLQDQKE